MSSNYPPGVTGSEPQITGNSPSYEEEAEDLTDIFLDLLVKFKESGVLVVTDLDAVIEEGIQQVQEYLDKEYPDRFWSRHMKSFQARAPKSNRPVDELDLLTYG